MRYFRERWIAHDITHADNVVDAKAQFAPPYDLVCLDHDLGGETYVPSEHENTGYQFARYLATFQPMSVVVHSWNNVGADRMVKALEGHHVVQWMPFGPTLLNAIAARENTSKQVNYASETC